MKTTWLEEQTKLQTLDRNLEVSNYNYRLRSADGITICLETAAAIIIYLGLAAYISPHIYTL